MQMKFKPKPYYAPPPRHHPLPPRDGQVGASCCLRHSCYSCTDRSAQWSVHRSQRSATDQGQSTGSLKVTTTHHHHHHPPPPEVPHTVLYKPGCSLHTDRFGRPPPPIKPPCSCGLIRHVDLISVSLIHLSVWTLTVSHILPLPLD